VLGKKMIALCYNTTLTGNCERIGIMPSSVQKCALEITHMNCYINESTEFNISSKRRIFLIFSTMLALVFQANDKAFDYLSQTRYLVSKKH